jgi:hypothetical protein
MPDFDLLVQVSRDGLGMPGLQLNDHVRYACAPQFLGATVTWKRQSVGSPFVDDEVTVSRTRGKVMEQIAVEVDGAGRELKDNIDELIAAMIQDKYAFIADTDAFGTLAYACEAADYQATLTGPRLSFGRVQCVFSMPRSPMPIMGMGVL